MINFSSNTTKELEYIFVLCVVYSKIQKYFVVFSCTGFLYFYYYLMDKFYFRDVSIDESLSVRENMGPEVEDLGVSVLPDASPLTTYVA